MVGASGGRSPRFGLEIDHDVRDRHRKPLACAGNDTPLEPVRAALRVRGDDDHVRTEGSQRILHRLERIGVADLPRALIPSRSSSRMLRASRSSAAARAWSSSDVQCLSFVFSAGRDDEHVRARAFSGRLDRVAERAPGDSLVRDDEDAALALHAPVP